MRPRSASLFFILFAAVVLLGVRCARRGDPQHGKLLSAAGVKTVTTRRGADGVAGVHQGEDLFLYAQVSKRGGAVSARFQAPLPSTVQEFDGDWAAFPPRGQASMALCAGDPDMLEFEDKVFEGAATPQ